MLGCGSGLIQIFESMAGSTPSCQPRASVAGSTFIPSLPRKELGAALGAVAVGLVLTCGQAKALTTDWEGSYTLHSLDVLRFRMKGDLQSDNNTIFINSFSGVTFTPFGPTAVDMPLVYSASNFGINNQFGGQPITSLNGSIQDFIAFTTDLNPVTFDVSYYFGIAIDPTLGIQDFIGGGDSVPGGGGLEGYLSTRWSLTAVSTSASVPGPLPIFGVASAFYFSRKLRKRIKNHRGVSAVSTPPVA